MAPRLVVSRAHGDILKPSPTGTFADSSQKSGLHTRQSTQGHIGQYSEHGRKTTWLRCVTFVAEVHTTYNHIPAPPSHLQARSCCVATLPSAMPSSRPSSSGWQYSPMPQPADPDAGFSVHAVAVTTSPRGSTPAGRWVHSCVITLALPGTQLSPTKAHTRFPV